MSQEPTALSFAVLSVTWVAPVVLPVHPSATTAAAAHASAGAERLQRRIASPLIMGPHDVHGLGRPYSGET